MNKIADPSLQRPLAANPSTANLLLASLLAGLCLLCGVSTFAATTTLFVENFEGIFPGANGWNIGDVDTGTGYVYWGRVGPDFGGEGTHGGSYKAYCAGHGYAGTQANPTYHSSMGAYMGIPNLDLRFYETATLTFWYKMPSLVNGDYAQVMVYADIPWRCEWVVSDWTKATVDLTPYCGAVVSFGFDFFTDGSGVAEGMYLDDILITGSTGAVPLIQTTPKDLVLSRLSNKQFQWVDQGSKYSWYRLCIANASGQPCLDTWVQDCAYWCTNQFPAGNYTWWVQGWNSAGLGLWSSGANFSLTNEPPGQPYLNSPASVSISSPRVTYYWGGSGHPIWHELCLYKDNSPYLDKWFSSSDVQHAGGEYALLLSGHPSGNYSWWVRGWNVDGVGPWSPEGKFSINLNTPWQISLNLPSYAASVAAAMNFTWHDDLSVDWYCLQIDDVNNGTNYLTQWFQGTDSYTLDKALPVGNYNWRIRGWNSAGMGAWSSPNNFRVMKPGDPDAPGSSMVGNANSWDGCFYFFGGDKTVTWYELYINRNGSFLCDQWFSAANLDTLNNGEVTAYPNIDKSVGNYAWWVRCWSPVTGYSPWSDRESFTLDSW